MKSDENFILIKYRQSLIFHDWTEQKRLDKFYSAKYTAIKAATVLDGLVKLLHKENTDKNPNLPKEVVSELATDITKISSLIGKDVADYDQLDKNQLYAFNNLLFSFYLFKFFFAKKKKLEELRETFGFAAAKLPLYSLTKN